MPQGFAYRETDRHDPQFYVLGGDEAKPCKTCVSRLVRNGRCWYVIEDGEGVIQAEGDSLRQLIKRVYGLRHSARYSLTAVLALIGQQWTNDGVFGESRHHRQLRAGNRLTLLGVSAPCRATGTGGANR